MSAQTPSDPTQIPTDRPVPAVCPSSAAHPTLRLRAREERDVVAAIPYLLGYHPVDSLVLLGLDGGRLGPTARLDLDLARDNPAEAGGHLGAVFGQAQVAECYLLVYHDDPDLSWLPVLLQALVERQVEPLGGWQVGSRYFWPLTDPAQRRPVADLDSSAVGAELVLAGFSPRVDRDALADDLTAYPPDLTARLDRAAQRLLPLSPAVIGEAIALWAGLLGEADVPPPTTPRTARPLTDRATSVLLAGINHLPLRDGLLVSALSSEPVTVLCRQALVGEVGGLGMDTACAEPDPERSRRALAVLTHLVRSARGAAVARPAAMLAYLHWWRGDGTLANVAVARALHADPDHSLAGIVDRALTLAVPPPWRLARQGADRPRPR